MAHRTKAVLPDADEGHDYGDFIFSANHEGVKKRRLEDFLPLLVAVLLGAAAVTGGIFGTPGIAGIVGSWPWLHVVVMGIVVVVTFLHPLAVIPLLATGLLLAR